MLFKLCIKSIIDIINRIYNNVLYYSIILQLEYINMLFLYIYLYRKTCSQQIAYIDHFFK